MNLLIRICLLTSIALPCLAVPDLTDLRSKVAAGDFVTAVDLGEQLLSEHPDDAELQFLTAQAAQQSNRLARAQALYETLLDSQPDNVAVRNNLAHIFLSQGDAELAAKLLREAIDSRDETATLFANLNRVYGTLAQEAYRQAGVLAEDSSNSTPAMELMLLGYPVEPEVPEQIEDPDSTPSPEDPETNPALVVATLERWVADWNQQRFDAYLDHYVPGFNPDSMRQQRWVWQQYQYIQQQGPRLMSFKILKIDRRDDEAEVILKQRFQSPGDEQVIRKHLRLQNGPVGWKIVAERQESGR